MASNDPGPLLYNMPIVDVRSGWPTQEFMRLWGAQRTVNITVDGVTTDLTALQADVADIQAVDVIAGTALSGGGNIAGPADITINHDDSAVTPGTYGDAANVPQITVDQQGHVTAVTEVAISGGGGLWWYDPPSTSDLGTAVTEGTVSATSASDDADVGLLLEATIGATDSMWARVTTAPATPFTVTAHFYHGGGAPAGNALIAGLVLRNSSTGLRTIFGPQGSSTPSTIGIRRATGTTFNATVGSASAWAFTWGLWLRIVVTTDTNIEYQISYDGKVWHVWQADTANGRVAGLDQIGLAFSRAGSIGKQSIACDYWAVT